MLDQNGHIMTFSDDMTHAAILSRRKRPGMYPDRNQRHDSFEQILLLHDFSARRDLRLRTQISSSLFKLGTHYDNGNNFKRGVQ